MLLAVGQLLRDRYRVDALLGKGGMGAVYYAWDTSLDIPVAIKENLDTSSEAQKQFEREARILARLSHPNLPRVTDHFFIAGQGQYLVMDFVEGEDLATMLARLGPLPEPRVLQWVIQICDALIYLHSQPSPIIHRDIKPGNIKIRPDGRAVLVDFGIAKVYDPRLATTLGAKAVTPGYSPPEQYGMGATDARSDIYALGATVYHLLTGQVPPDSITRLMKPEDLIAPRQISQQMTQVVEQVILRAVEVTTERRFQTVEELRLALTLPLDTKNAYAGFVDTKKKTRSPLIVWGGAFFAVAALVVSGILLPGVLSRFPLNSKLEPTSATVSAPDKTDSAPTAMPSPTINEVKQAPTPTQILIVASTSTVEIPVNRTVIQRVDAREGWQPTSVTVAEGQKVILEVVDGQWTSWKGTTPYNAGIGAEYICAQVIAARSCVEPLPTYPTGALVMRVGDQIVGVGKQVTVTSEKTGEISLRINDSDEGLYGNDGILTVEITVLE